MMKNIFLLLALFVSINSSAQTITGISPNQGAAGTTITATITGQNTFFMSGSPQGAQYIILGKTLCSHITGSNFNVIDDDHISADFTLPATWPSGPFDVRVKRNPYSEMTLPAAFTVTGGVDIDIQSVTPNVAAENSNLSATITGQNLQTLFNAPGFTMLLTMPTGRNLQAYNVAAVNANTLTADFVFLPYADTGIATLDILSSLGCFSLPGAVHVQGFYPKQLVSISPTQGTAGTTLNALITGMNTFFMSGSPQGFQSIQLKDQHCNIIQGSNPVVSDEDHFTADFNIPANSSNGSYDLHVKTNTLRSYLLPSALQITGGVDRDVSSFSPSGANAGDTVHATITGSDVDNILNAGTAFLKSNGGFVILATNIVATGTQATMDFVVPVYADNGFYELRVDSGPSCYALSQALQVQGGLPRGLTSITPSSGKRGQPLSALITGSYTFFQTGTFPGSMRRVRFIHSQTGQQITINPPNASVVDSEHVSVSTTLPFSLPSGFYDVQVETFGGTIYELTPGFEITGTLIAGSAYFDVDSNGVFNTGDVYFPGRKIRVLPDSVIAITDGNGLFNFALDTGQYTIEYYPDTDWVVTSSPHDYAIHVDTTDTVGLMFGLHPVHDEYALYVSIIGGTPRCGTNVNYDLTYINYGTSMVKGTIHFVPDSGLSIVSSNPAPDFISGDTLFWNYDSLQVFEHRSIRIKVTMPVMAFTTVTSYASVNADDGFGNILAEADDSLMQVVICSFDPNDKNVEPAGVLAGHYVLNHQYLEYLVRFQNTGNDTAFQVIILDTLDAGLDPQSLEVIGSSHPMQTHLYGNVVEFRFENILLPDSIVDEPNSHGYVKFRLLPYAHTGSGTIIHNEAGIYFDLNRPVITNTVFSTLSDVLPTSISFTVGKDKQLHVYPNPASERFTVAFENDRALQYTLRIYDLRGALLMRESTRGGVFTVSTEFLSPGMYLIMLDSSADGQSIKGKVIIY